MAIAVSCLRCGKAESDPNGEGLVADSMLEKKKFVG
jgi:hypothetical protein